MNYRTNDYLKNLPLCYQNNILLVSMFPIVNNYKLRMTLISQFTFQHSKSVKEIFKIKLNNEIKPYNQNMIIYKVEA